jgi:hypothetical protein
MSGNSDATIAIMLGPTRPAIRFEFATVASLPGTLDPEQTFVAAKIATGLCTVDELHFHCRLQSSLQRDLWKCG